MTGAASCGVFVKHALQQAAPRTAAHKRAGVCLCAGQRNSDDRQHNGGRPPHLTTARWRPAAHPSSLEQQSNNGIGPATNRCAAVQTRAGGNVVPRDSASACASRDNQCLSANPRKQAATGVLVVGAGQGGWLAVTRSARAGATAPHRRAAAARPPAHAPQSLFLRRLRRGGPSGEGEKRVVLLSRSGPVTGSSHSFAHHCIFSLRLSCGCERAVRMPRGPPRVHITPSTRKVVGERRGRHRHPPQRRPPTIPTPVHV